MELFKVIGNFANPGLKVSILLDLAYPNNPQEGETIAGVKVIRKLPLNIIKVAYISLLVHQLL